LVQCPRAERRFKVQSSRFKVNGCRRRVATYWLLCSGAEALLVPNARHIPQFVKYVPAMVEADLLNHGLLTGICNLLRHQLIVVRPSSQELLKPTSLSDANS
jgi:hypothetical protein